MRSFPAPAVRRSYVSVTSCIVLAAVGLLIAPRAVGDEPETIVRIEEDWEYQVVNDEGAELLPQVTCSLAPFGSHDGHYMSFELNHQSQPEFESGGLHLHLWQGETLLGTVHSQCSVTQAQSGDVVRWTQSVTLDQGTMTYEITNGTSTTWGEFGTGDLTASTYTSLSDLNAYDISHSLSEFVMANKGVSYLVLKNVRLVTSTGNVVHITVNHDVLDVPETEYNPEPEPGQ